MYEQFQGMSDFAPTFGGMAPGASPGMDLREQLIRSLTTGSISTNYGTVAPGNGAPYRLQEVENTIKIATFRMPHLQGIRRIPKEGSQQIEHQWVQLDSYGQQYISTTGDGVSTPVITDSQGQNLKVTQKFRQMMKAVAPQQRLVKQVGGDPVAREMLNGTMFMLAGMERSLYWGRATLDPEDWDGLEAQIEAGVAATTLDSLDARGASLDAILADNAATDAAGVDNYGLINEVHLALQASKKYNAGLQSFQRVGLQGDHILETGFVAQSQQGTASRFKFVPNTFIDEMNAPVTKFTVGAGLQGHIPLNPTVGSTAVAADAASKFIATDAGSYLYWVASVAKWGVSAAVQANAGVAQAVASGQKVTFSVTPGGGDTPLYYLVFRTRKDETNPNKARLILRVPNTAGTGTLTITDFNARLPGCTTVFMLEWVPDNISLLELLPLSRTPIFDPSLLTKWALVQYGTPIVRLPKHCTLIRNVDTQY